jgi:hypothetical protein
LLKKAKSDRLLVYFLGLLGVTLLFLASCYLGLGYLQVRDFDDALRFAGRYGGIGLLGFAFASGALVALVSGNSTYLLEMLQHTINWHRLFA